MKLYWELLPFGKELLGSYRSSNWKLISFRQGVMLRVLAPFRYASVGFAVRLLASLCSASIIAAQMTSDKKEGTTHS